MAQALSPAQENDAAHWCPGVEPGGLIDTPINPLIWPAP
jgi:hypothetical protein